MMKRITFLLICTLMLLGFAACGETKQEPTTTAATTPAQTTTAATSAAPTTAQPTTEAATDISFIYDGYWYQSRGNNVIAFRFEENGNVSVNTYRRKNITNGSDQPDNTAVGFFEKSADGTIRFYPDAESKDEFYLYRAESETNSLIFENDDPQGNSEIALKNFDTLSKENVKKIIAADN